MSFGDNAIVRVLVVMIAVAAGIRIIFWLLTPVLPYLTGLFVVFAIFRFVSWYRGRW